MRKYLKANYSVKIKRNQFKKIKILIKIIV